MNESYVEHFDYFIIKGKCKDGIIRTGKIIHMPFIGNEHQNCTMQTFDNKLHSISMRRIVEILGKYPRRF